MFPKSKIFWSDKSFRNFKLDSKKNISFRFILQSYRWVKFRSQMTTYDNVPWKFWPLKLLTQKKWEQNNKRDQFWPVIRPWPWPGPPRRTPGISGGSPDKLTWQAVTFQVIWSLGRARGEVDKGTCQVPLARKIMYVPPHPTLRQTTWGGWNYIAGYTNPLFFLFERTYNYSVDD